MDIDRVGYHVVSPTAELGQLSAVAVGSTGEPIEDDDEDDITTMTRATRNDTQTVCSLYEVTARLVSTVVQQQCRVYESASVEGRRVANALARMSYFVQPAVTSLLANTEVRAPSSLCARCGGRYVFRPCAKLKAARVNSMFNCLCLSCYVSERLTSYDCARLLDTVRTIGDMTFDCTGMMCRLKLLKYFDYTQYLRYKSQSERLLNYVQ